VYPSKPYLLVSRTGAKEKPIDTSIVYLPDRTKVIYAKPRSGFGSANLTMTLAGGQMTSFGQQTDTKIPELITSLAGMITARAGAEKLLAEAGAIKDGFREEAAPSTKESAAIVLGVSKEILQKATPSGLPGLDDKLTKLKSIAQALASAGAILADGGKVLMANEQYETVRVQAEELSKFPAPTGSTPLDESLRIVRGWAARLNKIHTSTTPEEPTLPAFELYEILQQADGTTELRRVEAP
jgi:hypothetical protein